jgi:hypothetical protein
MASRSIALVNRLRLAEAPTAVDCALAARLLSVDGLAEDVLDLAADLSETAEGEPTARKLRVRLAVLGETSRLFEPALESLLSALGRYFALRAEESDGPSGETAQRRDSDAPEGASESDRSPTGAGPVAAALADLAIPARIGEALEGALAELVSDCRRLRDALSEQLDSPPDIESTLDFLSAAEADMHHALEEVVRGSFTEGKVYRPGLAELVSIILESQ